MNVIKRGFDPKQTDKFIVSRNVTNLAILLLITISMFTPLYVSKVHRSRVFGMPEEEKVTKSFYSNKIITKTIYIDDNSESANFSETEYMYFTYLLMILLILAILTSTINNSIKLSYLLSLVSQIGFIGIGIWINTNTISIDFLSSNAEYTKIYYPHYYFGWLILLYIVVTAIMEGISDDKFRAKNPINMSMD